MDYIKVITEVEILDKIDTKINQMVNCTDIDELELLFKKAETNLLELYQHRKKEITNNL